MTIEFNRDDLLKQLEKDGLLETFQGHLEKAASYAVEMIKTHKLGWVRIAGEDYDIDPMDERGTYIRDTYTDVVILGTGGSSLGAKAATAIAPIMDKEGVALHVPDSLCPFEMDVLLRKLPAETTHILAISKSGTTAETLSQTIVMMNWFEENAITDLKDRFTFVTEPGERVLRKVAEKLGSVTMDHETDIGGRFSVLSNVGMLPVAAMGLNPQCYRKGAKDVIASILEDAQSSASVFGAALLHTLNTERGITQTVLMPYAESLRDLTRWWGQLWAESLGKEGQGTTPLVAVGPVDQHSQLQLYLDGPRDKMYTFITIPSFKQGPVISGQAAKEMGLDYMADCTIGDVVTLQSKATQNTLKNKGDIVREFKIDRLNEYNIGAIFMSYMLETGITAGLMGIDAYDQPAVEEGKILTRQYLNELKGQS
ncbi:hypothetical protein QGN29_02145 [Temperatibacter marinus]|uniref:Glucose-6-phosphate isomerase n=1 Tax=Temperatibacter marinus TaxID=1456591 RepID=A0AA52ECZ5_9PROT|nr:hypothetical protein [Temperatibacter marinus]WND03167.1 hypothetical protein QGN29_02145 [Temperatibacter marinus]